MSFNNELDVEHGNIEIDTSNKSIYGHAVQIVSTPIFAICALLITLFVIASIIVLSLIPIYIENKSVVSTSNPETSYLSVTYKTDLSDQSSITITNTNQLNQQFTQAYNLRNTDLSIVSYQFTSPKTSSTNGRKKRSTNPTQCEDTSTVSGVSVNFQYSLDPNKRKYTNYQWKQYLNKIEKNIRSISNPLTISIPFDNGQTTNVQMTFCSLEQISGDTIPTTTNNKSRLNCELAILGSGIAGSHSAYRLSPIYKNNLCIFERENHVGGRTYDIDSNGNSPDAYSSSSIAPMGAARFYDVQPVIKQLANQLNISYQYDYQTYLIKARGKLYTSYNDMCSNSYTDLNCDDDADGLNPQDQIWTKLIEEYENNRTNAYHFVDFNAYCRSIIGDEATDYLRDSFRFRADFLNTDPYSYMEFTVQDWNLAGTIYYPYQGLSQFSKRMISNATKTFNSRLYLNEQVLKINENTNKYNSYTFSIETTNYQISANQLIIGIPPFYWTDIQGTIANQIKSDTHFQSILPVKTIVIENYWSERWWENSAMFGSDVDRAWTRQNCISFIEIFSQHPEKKSQNLTKTVYDDGTCVEAWTALMQRSSQDDLINELLRGLKAIFTDVNIPTPIQTFTKVWPGAWHFQRSNSKYTNQQIVNWALNPIGKFGKDQITLVGEAYNINRSGWTDGAVKSSLMSLNSQFDLNTDCYENDAAANGLYCSSNFI